jgi:hypothetical protein
MRRNEINNIYKNLPLYAVVAIHRSRLSVSAPLPGVCLKPHAHLWYAFFRESHASLFVFDCAAEKCASFWLTPIQ